MSINEMLDEIYEAKYSGRRVKIKLKEDDILEDFSGKTFTARPWCEDQSDDEAAFFFDDIEGIAIDMCSFYFKHFESAEIVGD